jgi:hypothetical protein
LVSQDREGHIVGMGENGYTILVEKYLAKQLLGIPII